MSGERVAELEAENARLRAILDSPDPTDFMAAAATEARYQQTQRDDSWKSDADWFWLIGHLAGKALHRACDDGVEKQLHRITTVAAACANWHRCITERLPSPPVALDRHDATEGTK